MKPPMALLMGPKMVKDRRLTEQWMPRRVRNAMTGRKALTDHSARIDPTGRKEPTDLKDLIAPVKT